MRIHISLKVSNLDRSQAFYSNLFGQPASKQRPGYANFRLNEPPIHLALEASQADTGRGVSHLGIELPDRDTLEAWHDRLKQSGLLFAPEDEAQCCYARADKLWVSDPDDYLWEIWLRTGEYDGMGDTTVTPKARTEAETSVKCCA